MKEHILERIVKWPIEYKLLLTLSMVALHISVLLVVPLEHRKTFLLPVDAALVASLYALIVAR